MKFALSSTLALFLLFACNEEKKDICTCMKEASQTLVNEGFEVDGSERYPEGCKYMSEMDQEEIDKQLTDECREEIWKIMFGENEMDDFNFNLDDMDFEELDEEQ